ncbi:SAM-dependent methyltransferase, partial [Serratia bockelmannii]|uniref:SAM-dependent methyltransferase n=1 Tax=Serratia bockelmannii TaxID=2703793 RepID=UPI003CFB1F2F
IDLDPESLYHSNEKAKRVGIANRCRFSQQNAWELKEKIAFDVITSNGLNMYESDQVRLVALYRRFFEALNPGGTLLLSFLTP